MVNQSPAFQNLQGPWSCSNMACCKATTSTSRVVRLLALSAFTETGLHVRNIGAGVSPKHTKNGETSHFATHIPPEYHVTLDRTVLETASPSNQQFHRNRLKAFQTQTTWRKNSTMWSDSQFQVKRYLFRDQFLRCSELLRDITSLLTYDTFIHKCAWFGSHAVIKQWHNSVVGTVTTLRIRILSKAYFSPLRNVQALGAHQVRYQSAPGSFPSG
jgi:hypothetical protein